MKKSKRLEAESLRHQGKSIKEIARMLDVSQSTTSRWCADITLSPIQRNNLDAKRREAGAKALAPWIRRNRELKRSDIKIQTLLGIRDIGQTTKRDLFIFGLGLYWGEGYKRGSQEWGFTNSDPKVIRTILAWLSKCYDVPVKNIIARLTINMRYKARTEHITNRWVRETGIPHSQFGKPTFIQGYEGSKLKEETYRGTLRIKVRRGTSLRRRILASIAEIENQITRSSLNTAS
ncbi:MAG: helix-turn-helix domain-containing protein [Candidatus Parcubacteria bacterium]|nr:helix-turn-helix domain-containing protein [Candidatus Parcubacteria bacterium]